MNKYLGKVSEKALVSSAELVMKNRALYGFLKAKYVNLLIRQLNIEMFMQHTSPSDL